METEKFDVKIAFFLILLNKREEDVN